MNEEVRQRLTAMAERDVPDSVDVWPAVRREILHRRAEQPNTWRVPRLAWLAAALVAVLMLGLATYAAAGSLFDRVSTLMEPNDKGIFAVYEADLYHSVDIARSFEGVTVTIDWVYADPNRVLIGWHYETVDPQLGATLEALSSLNGQELALSLGIGDTIEPAKQKYIHAFLAPAEAIGMDTVQVTATFEISRTPITGDPPGNGWSQAEDGSWFFEPDRLGAFPIELTIPVTAGQVVEVAETVEAAGIPMTLERFVLAPSSARADVCFEAPDIANYHWGMHAELLLDREFTEANFAHFYDNALATGTQLCGPILMRSAPPADVKNISLQVLALVSNERVTGEQREIEGPWQFEITLR